LSREEPGRKAEAEGRGDFRVLSPYVARRWPSLAAFLLCSFGSAACAAAAGSSVKALADCAISGDWGRAAASILPTLGLIAASAAVAFGGSFCAEYLATSVCRDMRAAAVRRMLSYPYRFYEERHSGDLLSRLNNDFAMLQGFLQGSFAGFVRESLMFVVACAALALIDWRLLAPTVLLGPAAVAVNYFIGKPLAGHYRGQQEGYSALTSAVQDIVQGIGVVKAYGLYGRTAGRVAEANDTIVRNFLGVVSIAASRTYAASLSQGIPLVATVVWGGARAIAGEMSPGNLFAFLFLYRYLNSSVAALPDLASELFGSRGVLRRVSQLWEFPTERTDGEAFPADASAPLLALEAVRFSYGPEAPVIDGIELRIEAGRTVGLVGESGCGKSTLLKLLCALRDPDSGTISLFGKEYGRWNLEALRMHFSLVSQDAFLFPASVADNIAYGAPGASPAEVREAARRAGAAEFIEALPEGYGTAVGERGTRLSGGQRQRIAIARAFLKDAPILLLDEPTSSLDSESEARVQAELTRLMEGRTVVVAAHRLSTLRGADEILVLEAGRIVERGTHGALLESGGVYRRLYERQARGGVG
jgi:ABC-type multidrug transport system fused ATPase/permease subunit